MIVSGFTQRSRTMAEESITPPGQHSHCMKCRRVDCTQFADNVMACLMATCELCRWKCHECKMVEHQLSCPEEKVECLNKEYGCPLWMKRSKVASHLSTCPASVVVCTEEWSRWPMHDKDGGQRKSLPPTKSYFDCGQLDVGLAMRDQRMLIDSLHAPKKLRHSLRNPLTKKYPAVPFPYRSPSMESDATTSEGTAHTLSDDESNAPWDLERSRPGLESSICNQLFRVTKEVSDSVAAALEMSSNRSSLSPPLQPSGEGDPGLSRGPSKSPSPKPGSEDPKFSHETEQHLFDQVKSLSGQGDNQAAHSMERSLRSSVSSDRFSELSTKSKSTLQDMGGTQLHKITGHAVGHEGDITLHNVLGVSLGFDCISKYLAKPRSMYSFTCAQNFRRDEFRWHFQNVHKEIHQGLYGGIQHRCPLAYQGCTFFTQRLTPAQPMGTVFHSWLQESFGFRPDAPVVPLVGSSEGMTTALLDNGVVEGVKLCSLGNDVGTQSQSGNIKVSEKDGPNSSSSVQPSISDLASFDRDFNDQSAKSNKDIGSDIGGSRAVDFEHQTNNIGMGTGCGQNDSTCDRSTRSPSSTRPSPPKGDPCKKKSKDYLHVRPVLYTATNWDSKVLFHYNVEEENEGTKPGYLLTDLPFEVLQHIGRHLDSFSMCNLALTNRLLREVCCSLLEDQGIVVLNWEKQKSGSEVTWKVMSKRWMFSTCFEPIRSWKFTSDEVHMGDHLKVCPYNRDINPHPADLSQVMWHPLTMTA